MARRAALAQAWRLGAGAWPGLARAALELARARWRLRRHSTRTLIEHARQQGRPAHPAPPDAAARLVEQVTFAIPRVAAQVPWRADCFVQALAAQSWLARGNVASEIWIGTRQDRAPGFEAHAWLIHDGRVVTGGDVQGYVPVIGPQTQLQR